MIQSAKDLFIPNYNLSSTRKEIKNSVVCEEFASVLKTEDSRFVTKTDYEDVEKPVFIDNPISPERKFGVNNENFSTDFDEELTSSVENLYEKDKENESVIDENLYSVAFQIAAPFAVAENFKNDYIDNVDVDSNSDMTNSQEYKISDVPYSNIVTNDEEYTVPLLPDETFYENVSEFSTSLEGATTKEQSFIERNLPFPTNARNMETDNKSALINTMDLINKDENIDNKEVVLHESFILGYEEDEEIGLGAFKSDNPDKSLYNDEKKDLNIIEEPDNTGYSDLTAKIGKVSGKRDPKTTVKANEKALQTPVDKVQENTKEEIIEPFQSLDTEKNNAPKTIIEGNDILNIDDDEVVHKDSFGNQEKNNLGKEVKMTSNDDSEKPTTENRLELQDFSHKINEQRSLLNSDSSKNIATPQQMNLIYKGRLAFSESIDNIVRFVRSGENTKAVLIVDPPDLGRVNIEIVSTDNGIEAVLKVSNEQIKMLVQDQAVQLKQSLAEIGVNLSEFSVDIQQDDNRSRNQSFNNQGKKKRARLGDLEEESKPERIETFRVDLRKGLLHWIG